jgi:hypothetical protein
VQQHEFSLVLIKQYKRSRRLPSLGGVFSNTVAGNSLSNETSCQREEPQKPPNADEVSPGKTQKDQKAASSA